MSEENAVMSEENRESSAMRRLPRLNTNELNERRVVCVNGDMQENIDETLARGRFREAAHDYCPAVLAEAMRRGHQLVLYDGNVRAYGWQETEAFDFLAARYRAAHANQPAIIVEGDVEWAITEESAFDAGWTVGYSYPDLANALFDALDSAEDRSAVAEKLQRQCYDPAVTASYDSSFDDARVACVSAGQYGGAQQRIREDAVAAR